MGAWVLVWVSGAHLHAGLLSTGAGESRAVIWDPMSRCICQGRPTYSAQAGLSPLALPAAGALRPQLPQPIKVSTKRITESLTGGTQLHLQAGLLGTGMEGTRAA